MSNKKMTSRNMWGGRFDKGLSEDAVHLSYSLNVDKRLFPYDLMVNYAHVEGLFVAGFLKEEEKDQLCDALKQIRLKADKDPHFFDAPDEDVHSFVERHVIDICGDLGKKMHTGKSRNDQVITDLRLFLKVENEKIQDLLLDIMKTLIDCAEQSIHVLYPGLTHFQVGQPILLAHHFMAYYFKFERDLERFRLNFKSIDVCPLGSGALAGNSYSIDRFLVAHELGFKSLSYNSMDAVSDRDFLVEFCSFSSLCMTHLSRFCEELVLWSSPLIGFISIGDDYTTGSSLMPQKKNPDIAEIIRGKGGRVLGNVVALQYALKALPLTYNRDLQEDKDICFDTVDTLIDCLTCFKGMLGSLTFHEDAIQVALQTGHILATDFADYLVHKGIPFREAHSITGKVVKYADQQSMEIHQLSLADLKSMDSRIEDDVSEWLTMEGSVNRKTGQGGTSESSIRDTIKMIKETYKW